MRESTSKTIVAIIIVLSIIALSFLYVDSSVGVAARAAIAIALLVASGMVIQRLLSLQGGYGFYMMGSKRGLATIDKTSRKYRKFWDAMAIWGLTLGFGILTYPLLKGKIDKRIFLFGLASLAVVLFAVLPYVYTYGFQFINISQLQNAVSSQSSASSGTSILQYIGTAVTILGGFSGSIIFALFANTESILYSFVLFITNPSLGIVGSGVGSQVPGVAPIIPGIDIPLFAGIISLAILLIVHEFSHGVLARKAKVKLKSIGILVLGFIPIGGYVEPDEKMVEKLAKAKQTKIFSAGIAANFIAMLVFFALMVVVIVFVAPTAFHYGVVITGTVPNYPANGILKSGMQVLEWNNHTVTNLSTLAAASSGSVPNDTISVLTNSGLYTFKSVPSQDNASKGVIGVLLSYRPIISTPYAKAVYFLYSVFALSMLLNFLVAVVNLLPIPGLDGWRIYQTNVKSKRLTGTIGAFIIILLIVNVLPWIFYA